MSASADYRSRIYTRYATEFKDSGTCFDEAGAWSWGRAYRHHLRGWLPEQRAAEILDVACGGGRLLHFYKTLGYTRVAGVDVSAEQVALARQVVPDVAEADVLEHLGEAPEGGYALLSGIDIIGFHKPKVFAVPRPRAARSHRAAASCPRLPTRQPWAGSYRYGDFTTRWRSMPTCCRLMHLAGFRDVEGASSGRSPSAAAPRRAAPTVGRDPRGLSFNLAEIGTAGGKVRRARS
jgi:SAM-dependent methyltransferase